jgi:hypothetical protein
MINPYEPPQALDAPPPMAEPAPTKWPSLAETPQLPRAPAHCAWAGEMFVLAAFAAAVFLMSTEFAVNFVGLNLFSVEMAKSLRLMSGLCLGLLFVGGWFKNMFGQLLFVQLVQDPAAAVAYKMLFVLSLVKMMVAAAICLVLFKPPPNFLNYALLAFLILFAFLQFHTILLQAKALRRWQVLLGRPLSRGLLEGYKYLSLAAIVIYASQIWYWFREQRAPESSLFLGALLLQASSMVLYAKLYRQLESALKGAGR